MPRKAKQTEINWSDVREEFAKHRQEIEEEEEENYDSILRRSRADKVTYSFHHTIDNSTAEPKLSTRIAYGERYKNEKVSQLDPDQGKFTSVLAAAAPKGKKSEESAKED